MLGESERRKSDVIARVVELAQARLAGDKGTAAGAFLARFYANVAPEDLEARSIEDLYGAGVALWQFGRARPPGQAKVRVYNPRLAEHGWGSRHTEIGRAHV